MSYNKGVPRFASICRVPALRAVAARLIAVSLVLLLSAPTRAQVDDSWERTQEQIRQSCLTTGACDEHPRAPAAPAIWGAVALSKSTLISGSSWEYQSQQDAATRAVSECSKAMNAMRDCAVLQVFANYCAALATSPQDHQWGYSGTYNTIAEAESHALSGCTGSGGHACAITQSICSPARDQAPADAYTAIAVSADAPAKSGTSWRAASQEAASAAALKGCLKQSGAPCTIGVWARNSCAALATSNGPKYATAWNDSRRQAESEALRTCETTSGQRCLIQVSVCADAPPSR
jgi:hypothetical protein